MARTATCTHCGQRLTIPDGLDESGMVRCPLCDAEFPLGDVLAGAVEADDPEDGDAAAQAPELVPAHSSPEQGPEAELPGAEMDQLDAEIGQPTEEIEGPAAGMEEPAGTTEEPTTEEEEATSDEEEEEQEKGEEAGKEQEEVAEEKVAEQEVGEEEAAEEDVAEEEVAEEEAAEQEVGGEEAAEEEVAQVRCPCCQAEYALSDAIVLATGEPLGRIAAARVTAEGLPRHEEPSEAAASTERAPGIDVWGKADGMPQIDTGQGTQTPAVTVDAEAFAFGDKAPEAADASALPAAFPPRRKPKQKSFLRELVSWVFGGVAGLLIAYYALNWIRGEQGNFLKIPLPGVPHTYKHSPDWFPSCLKSAPDPEDPAPDETEE
jgi:hypothetical protein